MPGAPSFVSFGFVVFVAVLVCLRNFKDAISLKTKTKHQNTYDVLFE